MRNTKFLILAWLLGLGGTVLVALQIPRLLHRPDFLSIAFWAVLVVITSTVPFRRLTGTGYLNVGPIMVFTMLLLYGTGAGMAAGWLCGVVTALSSSTGTSRVYLLRTSRNSGKHALGLLAAGFVLWGTAFHGGLTATATPTGVMFLRLLAAYALYLAVKSLVEIIWTVLEHGTWYSGLLRRMIDRKRLLAWVTPLGAFILALGYVTSGMFIIGMLVVIGIARVLAVRDDGSPASTLGRLIDALRFVRIGDMTQLTNETDRVFGLAMAIGRKMQLPFRSLALLEQAAVLHNVGYISANRNAVLKPTQLTEREIKSVMRHPRYGLVLLHRIAGLESVAEIVHCHHEKPDGSGFPRGLRADEIPLEASIIKVAEAFVAMTSPRLYRSDRMSTDDALNEIYKGIGTAFEPVVGYYLFKIMGRDDLATRVAYDVGPPKPGMIGARLYHHRAGSRHQHDRSRRLRPALTGLGVVAASVATMGLLAALGLVERLGGTAGGFIGSLHGAIVMVGLLGLSALKGMKLDAGAYISWASAPVLAAALIGGPVYTGLLAAAFIGWTSLLGLQGSASLGSASERLPQPVGDTVAVISARVRPDRHITAAMYAIVLMVAGGGAWAAGRFAGPIAAAAGLGWIGTKLLPAALAISSFYLIETFMQSMLLGSKGLSTFRLWEINYLRIFPEPITYAVVGYGMVIAMDLIGPWAAITLMLLPIIWRHSALRRRAEQVTMVKSLVRAIVGVIDQRDKHTNRHSVNVAELAMLIARQIGRGEPFVEQLEDAALLHDIGKVSWPKRSAMRQDHKDETNRVLRLTHQNISAEIAAQAGYSQRTVDVIRHHHEQFDGGGFPRGLCGYEIPLGARILRVADGFEVSLHEGSYIGIPAGYRASFEIKRGSGTLYDPAIVRALLNALNRIDFSRLVLSAPKGRDKGGISEPMCAVGPGVEVTAEPAAEPDATLAADFTDEPATAELETCDEEPLTVG